MTVTELKEHLKKMEEQGYGDYPALIFDSASSNWKTLNETHVNENNKGIGFIELDVNQEINWDTLKNV